jgi:ABC-type branched-subunit amino acid transport system substrate-binding protein
LNSSVPLISSGITGANFGNATEYPHLIRTTYSDAQGIQALMQNLQARAAAASASPNRWAVLYTTEIVGAAGLSVVEKVAMQDSVVRRVGFASGSNLDEVRNDVRKLLSAPAFQGCQPIVLVIAPGPDTTTAMHALAAENVHGPPTADWIVGAIEAPESVVNSISDTEVAVGYNSYLTTTPSSCAAMDGFNARFQKRYQTAPTGGFAVASYDMVVLTAAALRAALATGTGKRSDLALIAAIRHKDFGVQGLGGPLVFQENENQPCGPPLSLTQLLPGFPFRDAEVGVINSINRCPRLPVGSSVTYEQSGCPSPEQPAVIQMKCSAKVQDKNTCIAKGIKAGVYV